MFTGSRAWVLRLAGVDLNSLACRPEKAAKRTVVLVIGYNGRDYHGFQQTVPQVSGGILKFLPTVESELELALFRAGMITPPNFGNVRKISWARAGRTDAGVSAVCTIVSARLLVDDDNDDMGKVAERVSSFLPPDIVIHGAATVSRHFNARFEGTSRAYLYMLPSFCVARGTAGRVRAALEHLGVHTMKDLGPEGLSRLEAEAGLNNVRLQSGELELLRSTLRCFRGMHFFSNFATTQFTCMHRQSWRYVREIDCGEPLLHAGREWLPISIRGDSFLTHQIRKMLGTAAMVTQGLLPSNFVQAALDRSIRCSTPRLPPNGLMFLRPYYQCSKKGEPVQTAIDSFVEGARAAAWKEQLQHGILEAATEARVYEQWMARTAHHEEDTRERAMEAVAEYEVLLKGRTARVAATQAGACQVAAVASSRGAPLNLGRHKWAR